MVAESIVFSFYRCEAEDADALKGGKVLSAIRINEKLAISHPDEWVAMGSPFDIVVTANEQHIVNGELNMAFVDSVMHRVIGFDHAAARLQNKKD